jgi:glycosidase
VTNYPLKNAIIACVKDGDAVRLADVMAKLCRNYPENVLHSLMNIVGTHDTARILTVLGSEYLPHTRAEMEHFKLTPHQYYVAKRRLRLVSTLQFTLPGVPCVYYGDEAGMQGGADPFNRKGYPWGKEDAELLDWYKQLSSLRQRHSCFKDGKYVPIEARAGVFAFTRGSENQRVLVAINTTDTDIEIVAEDFNYNILEKRLSYKLIAKAYDTALFSIDERI